MHLPRLAWNPLDAKHTSFICKSTKRFLLWLVHFPYYPYEELAEGLCKVGHEVAAEEIKEYEESSNKVIRRPVLVMISASLLFSIKILYHPWIIASTIDFKDLDLDSTNQWVVDNNTIQAFCIQSNCTRLFSIGTQYSLDIRHFPIIPTCHPILGRIYAPTIFLGPYAMLLHCVLGSTALAFGVITPLIHLYHPVKCDTLMFLVAPELTIRFMCLRAKKLYKDYESSYSNYIQKSKYIQSTFQYRLNCFVPSTESRSSSDGFRVLGRGSVVSGWEISEVPGSSHRCTRKSKSIEANNSTPSLQDRYAQDCLPNIRTMSQHQRMQRIFVKWLAFVVACIGFETLVLIIDLTGRFIIKSNEFEFVRHEMYHTGCRGWFLTESGERNIMPPYPTWTLKWNIATLFDSAIMMSIVNLFICFVSLYIMINHELSSWLCEIHDELEILIEITRYRSDRKTRHESFGVQTRRKLSSIKDADNVQMNVTSIRRWFELHENQTDRRKLISKICTQQLVSRKLSAAELSSDGYFDQMVKHYISLRLLMDYVNDCTNTISLLSAGIYLSCFLVESSTVWHGRLVGQFGSEHIMTIISCVAWAVAFLVMMSNFHAKVSTWY